MDSVINLNDVSKSFDSKAALKGITLEIPKGRIVGLVEQLRSACGYHNWVIRNALFLSVYHFWEVNSFNR